MGNNNWYQRKLQTQHESKDPFTTMVKKDTEISIAVLEKEDYFHWKVKMHLHLLSQDRSYVQCIEKGPHVPMKIGTGVNVDGTMKHDKSVPKTPSEFTEEDEKEVQRKKRP